MDPESRTETRFDPDRPLLDWRSAPFPVPWSEVFGRGGPLHLEVGFGDGRFTVRRAEAEPDARFVGLEISSASVQRALRRLRRAGIGNVRLAKLGARFAVRQLFAAGSLASITVNFPDPWPKARHEGNRLLQRSFFDLAAARLEPAGEIRLATDHPDYLAFAIDQARGAGRYRVIEAEPPAAVFETKYALKWKAQGKPLFYRVFRYDGSPAPDVPFLERPWRPGRASSPERPGGMPHALVDGSLPDLARFDKRVVPYGDGHVILHEAARVLGDDERWLVRATVDEPDLVQQVLVVVQRRSDGELIVRLETFGAPVITATVRGAVHAVADWLEQLGLVVTDRAY